MPHKVEKEDIFPVPTESVAFDAFAIDNEATWALLDTASAEGDLETVQEIIQLQKLRPLGYFIRSAVVGIDYDYPDMVASLLQAGVPVDESLVRAAVNSTHAFQFLRLFVTTGWDVNTPLNSHTPSVLALAAQASNLELVNWLLQDLCADVNAECELLHTPLSVALQHATKTIVDSMMSQPVRTDKGQLMHYALWRALEQLPWDTQLMDSLLAKGAPVNKKMYDCEKESEIVYQMRAIPFGTPLHIAVKAGSVVAVKYLLQHGARPDLVDEENKLPLEFATGEIRQLLQGR